MTPNLSALLDRLEKLHAAATPEPWFYNGYSALQAPAFSEQQQAVLDAYQAAGSPRNERGDMMMEWREKFYEVDTDVCHVPPIAGDTATGRHAKDAALIEEIRNALPLLIAELRRMDQVLQRKDNP